MLAPVFLSLLMAAADVPPTAAPADAVPVVTSGVGGSVVDSVARADVVARGLTLLDLSDDWTPRFLVEDPALGDAGLVPFRATYLGLAREDFDVAGAGRRAKVDRYLETWGIWPTIGVLQARLQDSERHACHAAVREADDDDTGEVLAALPVPLAAEGAGVQARRERDIVLLRTRVLDGRATDAERQRLTSLVALQRGILSLQALLVCDGLLEEQHIDGGFGPATARALGVFQRREALPVREGVVDEDTRARLRRTSVERDWLAVLRGLRERVVDAVGLLEDGSAGSGPGLVCGEFLDASIVRAPLRQTASIAGAGDVIASATDAAARALGLADPTTAAAALARLPRGVVAVALPPPPPWHAPHMELQVTLERGDVDDRGILVSGAARRPMLTIATVHQGATITLARLPTTIGGVQREKLPGGQIVTKKKSSPTGRFVWRHVWSQPSWYAPTTTPDDELVLWTDEGAVVNDEGIGPGYRSAYGLIMIQHHRPPSTWQGQTVFGETGIRTHGTGNVRSIFRGGPSHGCHRLLPLHVGRLASFLLAHRTTHRDGPIRDIWERPLHSGGKHLVATRTVRGVRWELTPPVDLTVLESCDDQ